MPLCIVITSSGLISISSNKTSRIYNISKRNKIGAGNLAYKMKIYIFIQGVYVYFQALLVLEGTSGSTTERHGSYFITKCNPL